MRLYIVKVFAVAATQGVDQILTPESRVKQPQFVKFANIEKLSRNSDVKTNHNRFILCQRGRSEDICSKEVVSPMDIVVSIHQEAYSPSVVSIGAGLLFLSERKEVICGNVLIGRM